MKIKFNGISTSQEKRLRRIIKPLLRFMPFWINEVIVCKEENEENLASAGFSKPYRRTHIGVGDTLLVREDDEVSQTLLHEICHAYNESTHHFFNEVLPNMLTQEQFNTIQPLYTRELESQTEDMSIMLWGLK